MGPIERELRERASLWNFRIDQSNWLSLDAFKVLIDAEISLGFRGPVACYGKTDEAQAQMDALWPDVYSEAIEAAEALSL